MVEFFRQPTAEERRDFKPIIGGTPEPTMAEIFREKLDEEESKSFNQKKPFCKACALIDFKEWADKNSREMERSTGYINFETLKETMPDLTKYSDFLGPGDLAPSPTRKDPKRTRMLTDKPAMEPATSVVAGEKITRQVQIGVHRDFKCKARNHGVSIFISNDELKAMSKMQNAK